MVVSKANEIANLFSSPLKNANQPIQKRKESNKQRKKTNKTKDKRATNLVFGFLPINILPGSFGTSSLLLLVTKVARVASASILAVVVVVGAERAENLFHFSFFSVFYKVFFSCPFVSMNYESSNCVSPDRLESRQQERHTQRQRLGSRMVFFVFLLNGFRYERCC